MITSNLKRTKFESVLKNINTLQKIGNLTNVVGLVLESNGPKAPIGQVCILRNEKVKQISNY